MSNFVSILIAVGVGLAGWLIVGPWHNTKDERLIGIAIFIAIVILLQFRPELVGNLHKKDDDQSDDGGQPAAPFPRLKQLFCKRSLSQRMKVIFYSLNTEL